MQHWRTTFINIKQSVYLFLKISIPRHSRRTWGHLQEAFTDIIKDRKQLLQTSTKMETEPAKNYLNPHHPSPKINRFSRRKETHRIKGHSKSPRDGCEFQVGGSPPRWPCISFDNTANGCRMCKRSLFRRPEHSSSFMGLGGEKWSLSGILA